MLTNNTQKYLTVRKQIIIIIIIIIIYSFVSFISA